MSRILAFLLLALGVLWLLNSALFTVDRAEYVYLTQFGRHVATYDGRTDAGLGVKWPWPIQSVVRDDNRLQFFDLRESELLTRDPQRVIVDKQILLDAYACWKMAGKDGSREGVDRLGRAVSTRDRARSTLEQRIISHLVAVIGELSLDDLRSIAPNQKEIHEQLE